jgi:hypothetical protein
MMSRSQPTYKSSAPNEPIILYHGLLTLDEDEPNPMHMSGVVRLAWRRVPCIEVFLETDEEPFGAHWLKLEDLEGKPSARINIWGQIDSFEEAPFYDGISGHIVKPFEFAVSENLSYIQLHLVNFRGFLNDTELAPDGTTLRPSKVIEAGGWKITISVVEGGGDLAFAMSERSGFGITHLAILERADGGEFTPKDASAFREALSWFFSFAMGYWCPPYLPVGFDSDGRRIWEEWDAEWIVSWDASKGHHLDPEIGKGRSHSRWNAMRLSPFPVVDSWCKDLGVLNDVFRGFMDLWNDDDWRDALKQAIHWYVESNLLEGGSRHSGRIGDAVVMTQMAMEMLTWVQKVVKGFLTTDQYEDIRKASTKITLLLDDLKITPEIPAAMNGMVEFAIGNSSKKVTTYGPVAITKVRNAVVHPSPKDRQLLSKHPQAVVEAAILGLWYLELVLLKLCKYEGPLSSRIERHR